MVTNQASANPWLKAAKVLWVVTAFLAKHTFKIVMALLSIAAAFIAAKFMADEEENDVTSFTAMRAGSYADEYINGFEDHPV